MMRRLLLLSIPVGVLLLLAGCAEPVVFSEVFQQKLDDKIYLKYNLWYTNPEKISSLNIQEGDYLPIGTEIEPVRTTPITEKIIFRANGREFTILYDDGYRLVSMRDFIAYTFTTTPPEELLKEVPPKNLERIKRGEVVAGMTKEEVILAWGLPPACRTPELRNESWLYWISPTATVRVVFRGGVVRNVININETQDK